MSDLGEKLACCFDLTYEGLKCEHLQPGLSGFIPFWSYLWGIEMRTLQETMPYALKFWSYLWGIEIAAKSAEYCFSTWFWSYLWGIEMRILGTSERIGRQVLILPMRDWNIKQVEWLKMTIEVLILPMRDWNSVLLYIPHIHSWSFDLTYEGLKLNKSLEMGWNKKVLILPMRDWNTKAFLHLIAVARRFDLTYEGLKSMIGHTTNQPSRSFWSYLWGIEIEQRARCRAGDSVFWSYLWGIEIRE